jgi:hypothetical protein
MESEPLIANYTFNQNYKYLVAATTQGFRYVRLSDGKVSSNAETDAFFENGLALACPFF